MFDDLRISLDPPPRLPLPPGQNPFHFKGISISGLIDFIQERAPDQFDAIVNLIQEPDIRAFMRQSFVAAGWYDALPILHLASAGALYLGTTTAKLLVEHAAWQVLRDMKGANKLLASKMITPEALAARTTDITRRYNDFAKLEVVQCVPGMLVTAVSQLPDILVPWFKVVGKAALSAFMHYAGAENIKVTYSPSKPDGENVGVQLVKFTCKRTWTRKDSRQHTPTDTSG